MLTRTALVFALLTVLAAPAVVSAMGTSVRPEMDVSAVLVARDLGGARWSIRLGLEGDTMGRATGIVTPLDQPNADAMFVQCEMTDATGPSDNIDAVTFVFMCYAGGPCYSRARGSCAQMQRVGERLIPASFFLPPR